MSFLCVLLIFSLSYLSPEAVKITRKTPSVKGKGIFYLAYFIMQNYTFTITSVVLICIKEINYYYIKLKRCRVVAACEIYFLLYSASAAAGT